MRRLLARAVTAVPSEAAFSAAARCGGPRARISGFEGRASPGHDRWDCGFLRSRHRGWVARHRQAVRLDDVRRVILGTIKVSSDRPSRTADHDLRADDQQGDAPRGDSNHQQGRRLGLHRRGAQAAQTLADHAAIAIENASLYRQAYVASITDDLTGLGNTRHFNRSLVELLRRGGPVSLILLDLDNFKAVVDGYGHLVGSRRSLSSAVCSAPHPAGDVAARFGATSW